MGVGELTSRGRPHCEDRENPKEGKREKFLYFQYKITLVSKMTQKEFSEKIKENWKARLRNLYRDQFHFLPGEVELLPPGPAYVAQMATWELTFYLPVTIDEDGEIQIQLNNSLGANWAFDILQTHNPEGEGYVSVDCSKSNSVFLELPRPNLVLIKVKEKLSEGKWIKVIFGDKKYGSSGAQLKIYTQKVFFYISFKKRKSSELKLIEEVPFLEVLPEKKSSIKAIVPSLVESRRKISLQKIDLDRFGNPIGELKEDVVKIKASSIKARRIYIRDRNSCARSNPFIQKESEYNLYWGEIHGHTYFSDGLEDPCFYYEYARNIEGLDFSSFTDHDTWLDERKWEKIKKVNEELCAEGRFITLLGFEWSSAQFYDPNGNMYGHKCVYYPGIEGHYYSHLLPHYNTPRKLWEKTKEFGAISIAHHPAYAEKKDSVWGTRWDYHDDGLQPLVEIYSKHGLSEVFGNPWPLFSQDPERFVQKALAKGYKLGFTAGTDTHISRPASNMPEFRRGIRYPKGGLTAVWTKELTRKNIFSALKNRKCYATTGERIIIKFNLEGNPMGSIVARDSLPDSTRINLYVFAAGTDRLEKVELIKDNQVIETKATDDEFLELNYTDKSLPPDKEIFYYVRVTQRDGNMGWSSPIYITRN